MIMKKLLFVLLACFTFFTSQAQKQKFGYIDSEYILNKLPEYRSAQRQLEDYSNSWQNEIDMKYDALDRKFREFKAEEPLLTPNQRREREEEIIQNEQEIRKLENEKFGPEGALFKKRQELVKPIQDKVFKALQDVAKENAYDFVFDLSGGITVLITNPIYDLSDNVLEKLGVKAD
jgi:outer membrane protein